MASLTYELTCELPVPQGATRYERLCFERLNKVVDELKRAADELYNAYHGEPDDDNQAVDESEGRAT